jgi:hypothetical protein
VGGRRLDVGEGAPVKALGWLLVVVGGSYAAHLILAGNWMASAGLDLAAMGLGGR